MGLPHHVELTVILNLANHHRLVQVVVGLVHGQGVTRRRGKGLTGHGFADFVDVRGFGFFSGLRPHVDAHVSGFHRVVGHRFIGARQVVGLGVGFPVIHKFFVDGVLY